MRSSSAGSIPSPDAAKSFEQLSIPSARDLFALTLVFVPLFDVRSLPSDAPLVPRIRKSVALPEPREDSGLLRHRRPRRVRTRRPRLKASPCLGHAHPGPRYNNQPGDLQGRVSPLALGLRERKKAGGVPAFLAVV